MTARLSAAAYASRNGALREALINAVVHRDYFEKGANVMVEMFDDRIELTNPGGLVKGLRSEDFGKRSALRNPNIANLLHRIEYIEKMGTGISKIRKLMKEAKLLPPKFEFNTFFTVTFKRPKPKMQPVSPMEGEKKFGVKFGVKGKRLDRLVNIIDTLYVGDLLVDRKIAESFQVSERTIEKDMRFLKENGLVEFEGAPKTGRYVLTEKGKRIVAL